MSKKITKTKEEKNKGGRPLVVLTDEQIKEVEELAAYLSTEHIADYFGIDRTTFYEILKRQPEVFLHYKKGRARKIFRYAKILENKAFGMNETEMFKYDTTSIIFFLKTQAGWSEKQFIETKDVTPKQPPNRIFYVNEKPEHRKDD